LFTRTVFTGSFSALLQKMLNVYLVGFRIVGKWSFISVSLAISENLALGVYNMYGIVHVK